MLQYGVRVILILEEKLAKYVRANGNLLENIQLLDRNYIGNMLRYNTIKFNDIANGPGIAVSVYL